MKTLHKKNYEGQQDKKDTSMRSNKAGTNVHTTHAKKVYASIARPGRRIETESA